VKIASSQTFYPEDGHVNHYVGVVPNHDRLMRDLVQSLPLKQESLRFAGGDVPMPRLTSWHGEPETSYTYSGKRFEPLPWPDLLLPLRKELAEIGEFNSVLVNYYRDGKDSVGFHADDEPELGPVIASVSLGASRRFVLKRKSDGEKVEYLLGGGDCLLMKGALQKHWVHSIPKTTKPVGPRMNLTFRLVLTAPSDPTAWWRKMNVSEKGSLT
jgi:alkylated DNA repair dioxygenase AlkB